MQSTRKKPVSCEWDEIEHALEGVHLCNLHPQLSARAIGLIAGIALMSKLETLEKALLGRNMPVNKYDTTFGFMDATALYIAELEAEIADLRAKED